MADFFNALDIVIVVVVSVSTAIAVLRGFTKEVLSITGWVLALLGTLYSFPLTKPLARDFISPDWLADGIVLMLTFILILIGFNLVAHVFSKQIKKSNFGGLDRILGAAFGVLRGLLVLVFAYYVVLLLLPYEEHPGWLKDGKLMPFVQASTTGIMRLIPIENLSDRIPTIDEMLSEPGYEDLLNGTLTK
ncbi:MAG: CvpA family protein [Parvibaculales bacterium]